MANTIGESNLATMVASAKNAKNSGAAAPKTETELDKEQLKKDYDNFLTLFLKQLQTQDPMAPMDNSQFTNSLANLSQVEQSVKTNENLGDILDLLKGQGSAYGNPVSFLGKTAEYQAGQFTLADGAATLTYVTPADATAAQVMIADASGNAVYTGDVSTTPGAHTFQWDGKANSGRMMEDGAYTVTMVAQVGEDSEEIPAFAQGKVTEVGFEDGKNMLRVGEATLDMTSVVRLID
ncbi:MAG: flagellar hook assembly protein FlgD [Rickettsiales bacterium]